MADALAEIASKAREAEHALGEHDYSVRAKAYAEWLDQAYRELMLLRSRYIEKESA